MEYGTIKNDAASNVRLMKAAPDLLNALVEMRKAIDSYASIYGVGELTMKILEADTKAEAAIKKAIG